MDTTTKRNRRRLPIPQHEFGFVSETFTLIQETGTDGVRLSRECADADGARRLAGKARAALLTPPPRKH